ncbi:MAG: transglycosylase domain-containing protein [Acidimicrobiales bacterium]
MDRPLSPPRDRTQAAPPSPPARRQPRLQRPRHQHPLRQPHPRARAEPEAQAVSQDQPAPAPGSDDRRPVRTRARRRTGRGPSRRPRRHPSDQAPRPERRSWLWRHRRILFLVWLFLFFGTAGALYLLSRVPLPAVQPQSQTSFIYAADGTQLTSINTGQNRVAVTLNQVPQVAINAVVATEDHNYYQHGGIDAVGVVRALVNDIRGTGNLQGGSTITQQYIKQAYLNSQRTLLRKIKEAALAVKLQQTLTKNQILERYLNTIYWGRGAYGIQAASQAYFQENVQQLTLPQAALLAGLIRGPEAADPVGHPSVAQGRRAESLASMVRYHKITQAQADAANASPLPTTQVGAGQKQATTLDNAHHDQYFLNYVEQQVEQRYPLGLGLRITTTLDLNLQDKAYTAIYGAAGLAYSGDPAGALVAVDNNGYVKAMVGGADYTKSQVNLAAGTAGGGSGRQAGSTFKPFLLSELVKEGYSVDSTLPGPPQVDLNGQGTGGVDYLVNNFGQEDAGPSVSVVQATAQSINTIYAQLEMAIGPAKLLAMVKQFGLNPADVGLAPNASLVLGTAQVSVLEMAAAYATFARGGVYLPPQVVTKVTTANGTPLPWPSAAPTMVISPAQDAIVEYCLQQVVQTGGTAPSAFFGTPIAGKTGTTSDFTDAWFDGFTPKLTAAVWVGYPTNAKPMVGILGSSGGVQGGGEPATLWRNFMQAATNNGTNPAYTGAFDPVTPEQLAAGMDLKSPTNLVTFPAGLGTATTTTTLYLPPAGTTPGTTAATTVPTRHTTPTSATVPTETTRTTPTTHPTSSTTAIKAPP